MKTMPLLIHFVFHSDSDDARKLAVSLHKSLNNDAIVQGLEIPSVFCDCHTSSPPKSQELDRAERSFVVVLADNQMLLGDNAEQWQSFVGDVWKSTHDSPHRFVPLQLSPNAWGFNQDLKAANISFGRAFHEMDADKRVESVSRVISVELIRFLSGDPIGDGSAVAPVSVFLSHAKYDLAAESKVVESIVDKLKADQPIQSWVDSGKIPVGSNFAVEIENGVKTSSVLAILTDNYSSREWCRREVLLAKAHNRPIVVVDALEDHEIRSFPYLGNVPVVRWSPDEPKRVIDLMLKATLRQLHTTLRLEQWKRPDDEILVRSPELVTIQEAIEGKTLLYPDPPLGSEELGLLERLGVKTVTPLERIASDKSLDGLNIAISISESTDIQTYGFDRTHFDNTAIELSRYLLIQGATLVYGGLPGQGYTAALMELVRTHNQSEMTDEVKPIINYVGWPIPKPNIDEQAEFYSVGTTEYIERLEHFAQFTDPEFPADGPFFPADKSAMHRYAWSRGMTEMREQQIANTAARIVLGGKTGETMTIDKDGNPVVKWYAGRIPGLLEEIYLSVKTAQPVFLIGAYGGVAAMVVDIIEGRDRDEATWEYQKAAPHSEELKRIYEERGVEWESYEEIVQLLRDKGIASINPLLSEAENRELFRTVDLMRMVELVIVGLNKLA